MVHACDYLMRQELGSLTTVEAIAERPPVLVLATFYSFYSSRRSLCDDVHDELPMLDPLEESGTAWVVRAAGACHRQAFEGRGYVIRDALAYRLERRWRLSGLAVGTMVDKKCGKRSRYGTTATWLTG